MPVNAAMASASADPKPKIRLQSAEPTPPVQSARLVMPSPEALGLARGPQAGAAAPVDVSPAAAPPAAVDWNDAHARLRRLGALGFHLDRLPEGGCRVSFHLPTNQPQRTRVVESVGRTEAEAVHLALQQAEQWANPR
jgi:hypothetical protein